MDFVPVAQVHLDTMCPSDLAINKVSVDILTFNLNDFSHAQFESKLLQKHAKAGHPKFCFHLGLF